MSKKKINLRPFIALEIYARAKEIEQSGGDVCHLEVGEPGARPSKRVVNSLKSALKNAQKYTNAKGNIELREGLCKFYKKRYGVDVDKENIIITMGSSSAFSLAFLSAFSHKAKIALTRPGYPAYLNIINALGFSPVEIELTAKNNWHLSAEQIEKAYQKEPFMGLLFASPANPTGATIGRKEFAEIISICEKLNILLISDEIYHGLEYENLAKSALNFTDKAIIINSFSKYFCLTGYRIGWMILPNNLVKKTEILQQNMFISAPTLSQVAALAALSDIDHCEEQKEQYIKNRAILQNGLQNLGFDNIIASEGAFYLYVDITKFSNNSTKFCQKLLDEAGVAATPGEDFDRANGHKYVRFSFAGQRCDIKLALKKMGKFLANVPD